MRVKSSHNSCKKVNANDSRDAEARDMHAPASRGVARRRQLKRPSRALAQSVDTPVSHAARLNWPDGPATPSWMAARMNVKQEESRVMTRRVWTAGEGGGGERQKSRLGTGGGTSAEGVDECEEGF